MTTRRLLVFLLLAVFLTLGGQAMAAIQGTRHDMTPTGVNLGTLPPGVTENRGTCSYCHVPHGAQGDRLWAGTPTSPGAGYGPVASLCYTCHLSGGVAGTAPYMFTSTSHGFEAADLASGPLSEGNTVATSQYPYTADASTLIDCTSCHDAHTSAAGMRPFIRTANSVSAMACTGCHGSRANTGFMAANTTGTHPVGAASGLASRTTKAPAAGYIALPANMNPTPYDAAGDWNLGQKQLVAGQVACVSCHAIHGTETSAPVTNELTMIATTGNFCQDCHGSVANPNNPGAGNVGGTHVVGEDPGASAVYDGNQTGNILNIAATFWAGDPATQSDGYPGTPNASVVCVSCHDIHVGEPNSPALVNFAGVALTATPSGNPGTFCAKCHVWAAGTQEAVNTVITGSYHHPSLLAAAGAYLTNFGAVTPAPSLSPLAIPVTGAVVDCMTCHRAHNAVAVDNTHILTLANRQANGPTSGICTACHTQNPSVLTTSVADARAEGTHYVDNVSGRAKAAGTYQKITEWTDGASPTYNPTEVSYSKYPVRAFDYATGPGAVGTANGVICESCHSVTSARYNNLLLGVWSPTVSTSNTVCGECHTGMSVATGTHPTLSDNVSRTAAPVNVTTSTFAVAQAGIVGGDLFYPGGTAMTCASCHRPHDANSTAGGYALRHGAQAMDTIYSASPPVNKADLPANITFTAMCLGCHVNSPGGGTY